MTIHGYANYLLFGFVPLMRSSNELCVCGGYDKALWWNAFKGLRRPFQILVLLGVIKIRIRLNGIL